jgi:putative ABC transport system permease protein
MDTLRQDLVGALRSLRRAPGFTAIVVLTLAAAIGPLTAIFGVVDAVLLRPLPFDDSDRIVQLWTGEGSAPHGPVSSANFVDWQAMSRSFEAIAAEDFAWYNLTSENDAAAPERLRGARVSPAFLRVLGVRPALGGGFTAEDEQPNARTVLLSDDLWTRRFGADRSIVGKTILLDGLRWRVAGVLPRGFGFPGPLVHEAVDLWTPLSWTPNELNRGMRRYGVTARLRAGVSLRQAQRELDAVAARLASEYPREDGGTSIRLVPVREELIGAARRPLTILLAAVSLVLLVACANAANLMLARSRGREREMALRAALGAGRGRLVRQLLTESLVLAGAAAAVGALASVWWMALYERFTPAADRVDVAIDVRIVLFLVFIIVLTAVTCGLVAALRVSSATLAERLQSAGRAATQDRDRRRFSGLLVILEIAMAIVLLIGAGLLVRSFERLTSIDPGFDPNRLMVARLALGAGSYDVPRRRTEFVNQALRRLTAVPGVTDVGVVDYVPFGQSDLSLGLTIETQQLQQANAHVRTIGGRYLEVMRIPLLRGRSFDSGDAVNAPPVGLVNQAMANRYWPGESAVGRRVRLGSPGSPNPGPWITVVGVIGNVKHWNLSDAAAPELYLSMQQDSEPAHSLNFVLRFGTNGPAAVAAAREALLSVDRRQPATWESLRSLIEVSVAAPRFRGLFLGSFAVIALVLAIVGLYGVISVSVTQRTRELGVRIALGARAIDVERLVLGQGMGLAILGVVLGIGGALLATRLLTGMLYGVRADDPQAYVLAPAVLLMAAAVANYLPARRAARVDPVSALQSE